MPNPLRFTTTIIPQHQEGRAFAAEISCLIRSACRKCATPTTKFIHQVPFYLGLNPTDQDFHATGFKMRIAGVKIKIAGN